MDVKLEVKKFNSRLRNAFGEDVGNLKMRRHISRVNFASENKFEYSNSTCNMLGVLMETRLELKKISLLLSHKRRGGLGMETRRSHSR
jgi:hypothetical protein